MQKGVIMLFYTRIFSFKFYKNTQLQKCLERFANIYVSEEKIALKLPTIRSIDVILNKVAQLQNTNELQLFFRTMCNISFILRR